MFAGTEEPAAFGELFSIGAIGGDKNKQVGHRELRNWSHAAIIWQHELDGVLSGLRLSHSSTLACICLAQTQMLTNVAMQISKIISDVVSSKLGVPSDRFYLSVSFCCAL